MINEGHTGAAVHAAHWDLKYRESIKSSWTENPVVQRTVNKRMTGNPDLHWLNWVFEEFLPVRPQKVLSVGCGDGSHELIIARQSYADFVYGFDASPVAIELANRKARDEGLNAQFEVKLFEEFLECTPEGEFDVAMFAGSLHHVRDIEGMLFAIQKVVKPGGFVVVNEYVGPAYQLYGELQQRLVNDVLGLLPRDLLIDPDFRLQIPTMRTVYATDPSEGVRAPLIPTLLPRFFTVEMCRQMNGALLHPLFDGLNGAVINIETPENQRVIERIIDLEDMLTEAKILSSDFMFAVYRNDLQEH